MKLKDWRKLKKISAEEVAAHIGRDPSTVYRWEAGATRPRWEDYPKLEELTDGAVTISDFVSAA